MSSPYDFNKRGRRRRGQLPLADMTRAIGTGNSDKVGRILAYERQGLYTYDQDDRNAHMARALATYAGPHSTSHYIIILFWQHWGPPPSIFRIHSTHLEWHSIRALLLWTTKYDRARTLGGTVGDYLQSERQQLGATVEEALARHLTPDLVGYVMQATRLPRSE